jgi:hypothetical protein
MSRTNTYSRPPIPRSVRNLSLRSRTTPASAATSAVLAAPVSTSRSGTLTVAPRYVRVAVTNARSCRRVSCTDSPDPAPVMLFDLELCSTRVDEAELSARMFAPEPGVAFHRGRAIGAALDDRNLVPQTPARFGARVEGLDHQPSIWVRGTHFDPAHARPWRHRVATTNFLTRRNGAGGTSWQCGGSVDRNLS